MSVTVSTLALGLLAALRFVTAPSFLLLAAFSFGWKRRTGAWLPLWKLGLALLAVTLVGTLGFAAAWHEELTPAAPP